MGEQVANGDAFSYNKHVRDLPLTQASIPIQHVGVVSSIRPNEASCVFLTELSTMRVLKTLNMLDDGTSGSNRIRISKQECCMVGSMQDNMDDVEIRFYLRH
ncbi:hypothetical protein O0I10_010240 [Lichtheimia ornata]|uniref:Uncharacterized protein n=1 Tax=Lichtheimia ornata TaxID=688661 RepID=A0AAD7UWA6_9FUNG|nr:uncharacterized protein O0I10_010240 [Lichtheimia ornata]KAJ8654029.1 hypothetical protein O0I10_010240 [Lichtheimia ornata]